MTLVDIALVLEDFAAGRTSDRAGLQAGALALTTLRKQRAADRDLMNAAAALQALASTDVKISDDTDSRNTAARTVTIRRSCSGTCQILLQLSVLDRRAAEQTLEDIGARG